MKDKITKIRGLLDSLEIEASSAEDTVAMRMSSGLELPDIMRDVVDLLIPFLRPYEVTIYLYMLRHSIIETGSPHLRVSSNSLKSGLVRSSTNRQKAAIGKESIRNQGTVRKALRELESLGAIRKEGEPNNQGTLYKVLLPEEIEVCQQAREERDKTTPQLPIDEREIDFYNVRENRVKVYERDNYRCQYCDKQLTRFTATLDHVTPVAEGGDNSFDNLLTACLSCNSQKNARPVGDFIAERSPT